MPIVGLPGLDRVVELADQEIGGRGGHSQETIPIEGRRSGNRIPERGSWKLRRAG